MKTSASLKLLPVLAALLVASPDTLSAQTVGRIRKSLDKATGGASAAPTQPSQPAPPAGDPQAAARARSQAQADAALADKRNKAAQVGVDQRVVDFLKQRIEDGSADAALDLAKRYEEGKGVVADPDEARRLYELSAERGNTDALAWIEAHPETAEEKAQRLARAEKAAKDAKDPKAASAAKPATPPSSSGK